jgi:hypothetical protein
MTQQEIKERNKEIALMLGLKPLQKPYTGAYQTSDSTYNPTFYHDRMEGESWYLYPQYDSDWNWLMEAVEFIEKLKGMSIYIGKNRMNKLHSVEISYEDNTWQKRPHIDKTIFIQNELKKEAVFIAVSDFAKLYNNKQL